MATAAPHDLKLEAALLGAVLISPDLLAEIDLPAEAFFSGRHRWIWEAMKRLAARGEAVDTLTLEAELKSLGRLGDAGGVVYLARLAATPVSSLNAPDYAARVVDLWRRRRYLQQAERVAKAAYDPAADPSREAEAFLAIAQDGRGAAQAVHVSVAVNEAISAAHHAAEHPDEVSKIFWGLPKLDRLFMAEGDQMTILAARPGEGKSSLALTAAIRSARAGRRVLLVSLEMAAKQLGQRVAAQVSGIPIPKIRRGKLGEEEWEALHRVPQELAQLPLEILHLPGATPAAILAAAERFKARHGGIDTLILDYLGLVSIPGAVKPYDRVSSASLQIRRVIGRLGVYGLVVHQLNRKVEERMDKRPNMADLRESGRLEQDADDIFFIYPRPDTERDPRDKFAHSCLWVEKVRQGPAWWHVPISRIQHTTEIVQSTDECPDKDTVDLSDAVKGF